VVIDRVKIADVAQEVTAGEPVVDGGGTVVLPRTGRLAYSIRDTMGSLMVAAPLANRHRSFAGDEAERRRAQIHASRELRSESEMGR
jgi:hypothetical protein